MSISNIRCHFCMFECPTNSSILGRIYQTYHSDLITEKEYRNSTPSEQLSSVIILLNIIINLLFQKLLPFFNVLEKCSYNFKFIIDNHA